MSPPALQFSRLTKSYGQHAVLKGLDLSVADGEIFGLVGVNGAGKTTLIKCLLDFCEPDGGQIEIFGISHRLPLARVLHEPDQGEQDGNGDHDHDHKQ